MKKYGVLILIIIITVIVLIINNRKEVQEIFPVTSCYTLEEGGVYALSFTTTGNKVTGNLSLLPFEKDSKTGSITGTVTDGIATLVWDVLAEGMRNTESLSILISPEEARIGFGEMVLQEGAHYVYKNPSEISYTLVLPKSTCSDIQKEKSS